MSSRFFLTTLVILLFFLAAVTPLSASSPFSQTQFTPDISLILDCSFHYFSHQERIVASISPFQLHPGSSPDLRAIQWNYLELAFSSVVDPYFDFFANIVLEDGEVEVEEAFVKTRFLPAGFSLKIGRFLSAFGRLNGIHEHQWCFDIAPLIYQQSFGDILSEKGAQLTWVLPTDIYLMTGAEYLLGENETSFNRGGEPLGTGMGIITGFIKASFDFGNWVVLGGASVAHGSHRWDLDYPIPSEGDSTVWGTDLTIKYQIDSYRHILLQGEYLSRRVSPSNIYLTSTHQHGGYLDLVWRMSRRWRSAVRVDWLNVPDGPLPELRHPMDLSAMVEFNPTEFSRIRLFYQLNRHLAWQDERFTAHQVGLSLNVAIGAHGAHAF